LDQPRKLRLIELAGAHWDRGLRHGQALAGEIRRLRRALLAYLARVSLYAGALPFYGLMLALAQCFRPFISPGLKQEMGGRRLTAADFQAILADEVLCNRTTVTSAVFAPEKLTLWVARAPRPRSPRGRFRKYPYGGVKRHPSQGKRGWGENISA
jgi:hypothetical protein